MRELLQVEGQVGRGDADGGGDFTRREPRGSGLHEQPENREPGLLREGRKGSYGLVRFHDSTIIESLKHCQVEICPQGSCRRNEGSVPGLLAMLQRDTIFRL